MNNLGALLLAGAGFAVLIGLGWWIGRRKDKRLAASRPGMTPETFVETLCKRGVDADIADEIYAWIAAYYGPETPPNADDRMREDVPIDPEDIEGFVAIFFERNDMPMPDPEGPEAMPDPWESTLSSFALYLTQRRAALLGGAEARA